MNTKEKNSYSKAASPAVPLIALGALKGYVSGTFWFFAGTILTLPAVMKKYKKDFDPEFLKSAGFMLHLYNRLQNKMSKEKAFEVTRAVVLCSATSVMQANFRNVEVPRNFKNLIKYQQRTNQEGATKNNLMEVIEQTEDTYRFKIVTCQFYDFFKVAGAPELTSIMCAVDNAVFNSYLPNQIVFSRGVGETFAEGAEYCSFCVKKCK